MKKGFPRWDQDVSVPGLASLQPRWTLYGRGALLPPGGLFWEDLRLPCCHPHRAGMNWETLGVASFCYQSGRYTLGQNPLTPSLEQELTCTF